MQRAKLYIVYTHESGSHGMVLCFLAMQELSSDIQLVLTAHPK